uniref:Uncharacterized protein n=1 Tax=Caenorhabditis japonica TaxID=281687 RepID=A0A8R1IRE7_CAEJA
MLFRVKSIRANHSATRLDLSGGQMVVKSIVLKLESNRIESNGKMKKEKEEIIRMNGGKVLTYITLFMDIETPVCFSDH